MGMSFQQSLCDRLPGRVGTFFHESCQEEAQQLERDVDKIKLDVQDAIKKVGLFRKLGFVDSSTKQVRIL